MDYEKIMLKKIQINKITFRKKVKAKCREEDI